MVRELGPRDDADTKVRLLRARLADPTAELRLDLEDAVTALEGVLAVHARQQLRYSSGHTCAVDYDRGEYPCATRRTISEALRRD